MNPKYPHLLSPAQIGEVKLRNRVVMAAMGMSQSDNGFVNQAVLNHYAARAAGGVGAVVVEVTCVDAPLGLNTKGMLVIDDDQYIPGMSRLAEVIHAGGAKAFLQISHTGRGARRAIIGQQPVGPSAVPMPYSFMITITPSLRRKRKSAWWWLAAAWPGWKPPASQQGAAMKWNCLNVIKSSAVR